MNHPRNMNHPLVPQFIVACTFFLFINLSIADDVTHLTGSEAAAIMVAGADFKEKKYSHSHDLRHYTVDLERHGKELEIIFVPGDDSKGTIGGGTDFGLEVHYFVSLDRLKIVRFHFAR